MSHSMEAEYCNKSNLFQEKPAMEICNLSASDLRERILIMLQTECESLPHYNYIETVQRDGMKELWRRKVTCWLLEFQEEFRISQDTVAVAVNYMDRYLSQISTKKSILQLLAMGAVFIAAKLHETYPIGMSELQTLAEGMYLESDIKLMELELLRVIQWQLNPVTPQTVMNHMVCYVDSPEKRKLLREHAEAFLDVALCEYEFIGYLPSVQGVSAILCAFETTKFSSANWIVAVRMYRLVGSPEVVRCKARMQEVFYNSFPDIARAQADSPTGVDELVAAESNGWSKVSNMSNEWSYADKNISLITVKTDHSTTFNREVNSPVAFCEKAGNEDSVRPVPQYTSRDNMNIQTLEEANNQNQTTATNLRNDISPPGQGTTQRTRASTH